MTWSSRQLVAAAAAAAALGWATARLGPFSSPAPALEHVASSSSASSAAASSSSSTRSQLQASIAPGRPAVRIVTRWRRAPAAPGCPAVRELERTEDRGPLLLQERTAEASAAAQEARGAVDLVRRQPAPARASWGISAGVAAALAGELRPVAGVDLRLVGPLWVALQVLPSLEAPLRSSAILSLRLEQQ